MKALFFDIDGTLVSFKTHQIPQSAVDAIAKAHQAGHKIIISTGRPSAIINNLGQLQSRGLIDGYITMNGGYCFVGDKVLHKVPMAEHEAKAIDQYCQEHNYPCLYVGERSLTVAGANRLYHEVFTLGLEVPTLPHTHYGWPLRHSLFQITAFFPPEEQPQIQEATPGCEYGRWHPAFVDITARGVTKAQGMDTILEYLNIPLSDSVAFGDGGNDIAMLRHAAVGVAMGNACDDVKAAADLVTRPIDDDGLAYAINLVTSD